MTSKHGTDPEELNYHPHLIDGVRSILMSARSDQLVSILDEITRTQGNLRTNVSPKYVYDERWSDVVTCLLLDGYRIENHVLIPVEPEIEGAVAVEDDLTHELEKSGLTDVQEIERVLVNSADAFRRVPPDYNACLSNVRVALETLAGSIANYRQAKLGSDLGETKWGHVLAYLCSSNLISKQEEKGLAGVFGFVSPGAHSPIGLSEEEMARLGRSLAVSMCYFLVKLHNKEDSGSELSI